MRHFVYLLKAMYEWIRYDLLLPSILFKFYGWIKYKFTSKANFRYQDEEKRILRFNKVRQRYRSKPFSKFSREYSFDTFRQEEFFHDNDNSDFTIDSDHNETSDKESFGKHLSMERASGYFKFNSYPVRTNQSYFLKYMIFFTWPFFLMVVFLIHLLYEDLEFFFNTFLIITIVFNFIFIVITFFLSKFNIIENSSWRIFLNFFIEHFFFTIVYFILFYFAHEISFFIVWFSFMCFFVIFSNWFHWFFDKLFILDILSKFSLFVGSSRDNLISDEAYKEPIMSRLLIAKDDFDYIQKQFSFPLHGGLHHKSMFLHLNSENVEIIETTRLKQQFRHWNFYLFRKFRRKLNRNRSSQIVKRFKFDVHFFDRLCFVILYCGYDFHLMNNIYYLPSNTIINKGSAVFSDEFSWLIYKNMLSHSDFFKSEIVYSHSIKKNIYKSRYKYFTRDLNNMISLRVSNRKGKQNLFFYNGKKTSYFLLYFICTQLKFYLDYMEFFLIYVSRIDPRLGKEIKFMLQSFTLYGSDEREFISKISMESLRILMLRMGLYSRKKKSRK